MDVRPVYPHPVNVLMLLCFSFFVRLVLPSSSPRWQKNQIDIKMYLSGVVQVCAVIFIFFLRKLDKIRSGVLNLLK